MTGWASGLAALVAGAVTGTSLFGFADPSIVESSGLVDAGDTVYTVNDSGDGPVLYAVDTATGRTAGTTTYSADAVVDVEALAPAPDDRVWVADIGDNLRRRETVSVYRVTPGRSRAPRYDLAYPDGPRDAETLLAHPVTGRLFVVSKTVFGGTVYAAPRRLDPDRTNRLTRFAEVPGFLTDGAFVPDGRHVLVRGYGRAWLLDFPGFGVVGAFDLPEQDAGEGLSVGPDGRVLLSTEGAGTEVLEVRLPRPLRAALEAVRESEPSVAPDAGVPEADLAAAEPPSAAAEETPTERLLLLAAAGALAAAALLTAVRFRRSR